MLLGVPDGEHGIKWPLHVPVHRFQSDDLLRDRVPELQAAVNQAPVDQGDYLSYYHLMVDEIPQHSNLLAALVKHMSLRPHNKAVHFGFGVVDGILAHFLESVIKFV